jgi:SAM-dependent methyltransferase
MNIYLSLISDQINSLIGGYNKSSTWAKVFILTLLLLLVMVHFKSDCNGNGVNTSLIQSGSGFKEGFEQSDKFVFKEGPGVYDEFYADIYDYLVYNNQKDEYEIGEIINKTTPTSESRILDVGCGIGHHVALLEDKQLDTTGLDISEAMIKEAKAKYPNYKFEVGDALNPSKFGPSAFTHILCLYFTIYYFDNKQLFFENAFKWLVPGGTLVIHLVNRDKFDPILPPGNPLLFVSPQKYAKKRITSTNLIFDNFDYNANFDLDKSKNIAKFTERFKFQDGKSRKNEHTMYMETQDVILQMAQDVGFILQNKLELMHCSYDFQYMYVLTKAN